MSFRNNLHVQISISSCYRFKNPVIQHHKMLFKHCFPPQVVTCWCWQVHSEMQQKLERCLSVSLWPFKSDLWLAGPNGYMHPKVQVSAEHSGQWHWGCQSGSGLASNFFGSAYQHISSISLPVPKHGWALKSAVWEPVYKTTKSNSCCSVRLFIIQFWEVVTCIVVLLSARLESISH